MKEGGTKKRRIIIVTYMVMMGPNEANQKDTVSSMYQDYVTRYRIITSVSNPLMIGQSAIAFAPLQINRKQKSTHWVSSFRSKCRSTLIELPFHLRHLVRSSSLLIAPTLNLQESCQSAKASGRNRTQSHCNIDFGLCLTIWPSTLSIKLDHRPLTWIRHGQLSEFVSHVHMIG